MSLRTEYVICSLSSTLPCYQYQRLIILQYSLLYWLVSGDVRRGAWHRLLKMQRADKNTSTCLSIRT